MLWDLYCRVIDNHGDLGVCWRLAADLAARGERVRLWVDDASALTWMAPEGAPGVDLRPWPADRETPLGAAAAMPEAPGEVVIEAFGCELPAAVVERMASAGRPPVWINLEYLSAEAYVERSHRLLSPQANGLRKWFFYPGFTPRTGGLLREPDLAARQLGFDAAGWLARHGLERRAGERVVSLFCYEQPALAALLESLALPDHPMPPPLAGHMPPPRTLLLATPGHAARQVRAALGPGLARGGLRAALLPALTQRGYDELLWACDLNFVRGEDSFVRAQWAGRPFVWQAYPQADGAHRAKLDAFLDRFLAGAEPALAVPVRAAFAAWNAAAPAPALTLPPPAAWARQSEAWRAALWGQDDLATQLIGFVAESR